MIVKRKKEKQAMITLHGISVYNSLYVLCISTSEWVLHTPFAGQNRLSDAKTTYNKVNQHNKAKRPLQGNGMAAISKMQKNINTW